MEWRVPVPGLKTGIRKHPNDGSLHQIAEGLEPLQRGCVRAPSDVLDALAVGLLRRWRRDTVFAGERVDHVDAGIVVHGICVPLAVNLIAFAVLRVHSIP